MHINVSLPPSEFVDRFLVFRIRVRKLKNKKPAVAKHANKWVATHRAIFKQIIAVIDNDSMTVKELAAIHEELWLLEDRVRAPSRENNSQFQNDARLIFQLNDRRHQLKLRIDEACGVALTGIRIYAAQK